MIRHPYARGDGRKFFSGLNYFGVNEERKDGL
jgi:hypothetical protein